MSKHVHPTPRTTLKLALKVMAEILIGLPTSTGRRAAK